RDTPSTAACRGQSRTGAFPGRMSRLSSLASWPEITGPLLWRGTAEESSLAHFPETQRHERLRGHGGARFGVGSRTDSETAGKAPPRYRFLATSRGDRFDASLPG